MPARLRTYEVQRRTERHGAHQRERHVGWKVEKYKVTGSRFVARWSRRLTFRSGAD